MDPATECISSPPARLGSPHRSRLTAALFITFTAGISLAVGVMLGRAKGTGATPIAPQVTAESHTIELTAEETARAGIQTQAVASHSLRPALELVGSVEFDADLVAEVGARIPGRVKRLFVRPGASVTAGQALVEIESAELGDAVSEYLAARANQAAAQANVTRERSLSERRLSTARALEEAEATAHTSDARVEAGRQRLLAMGIAPTALRGSSESLRTLTLRSPIAGQVISREVVLGQLVALDTELIRVADMRRLWVQLDVFERDLARVHVGDQVELRTETWPGRVFRGQVGHIGASIDLDTRTGRVRIEVENTELLLRPGQFVTARLRPQSDDARTALTVPRTAIVQLEGRPAVFTRAGRGYRPQSVELGVTDGDNVEVRQGLHAGDNVVTEGAFALKSELQR